ncbi:proline-, glutamic acid- and leucine-rich protein 1 [Mytilus galloprovincialis]|uniref:Proline-, glutamic acid- and leucine-rich protein 1 n=1 Tax=Mytilus galloprovincialis TaxID=29158 RepID=A0A8B6FI63_MYTGA|nr:proline-, glutamic acid- and leucine-rich protein 1 [Mytilus galloprovincialis]
MDAPMENVIFAFKSEIIKNSKDINDFTCLLQLTDENKFFSLQKTYGLQETISYIHGCLNTSKLRIEGLILLEKLTEQCVTEVFTQNAVTWTKFIVQCLESHDPVEVKRLSCCVGCKIIPLTVNFTALSKDIISVLPQLLATLIAASSEWLTASLKLLGVCIQSYPGPCGTFKTKLDVMVTELFKEQSVPKEAIALYVLLARVGGGGNKGIHFTEAWSNKFQQIITSLTEVVNLLYNGLNIPELESTFSVQVLPMRELPETYTNRFNILSSYHHTYCLCLQELLSQPFPAPVKIPVSDVIRLVTKVLSVNIRDLKRLLLSGYISTLHSDAVLCLHSLISRCKTLLLPYSKTIITVMVKELMLLELKLFMVRTGPTGIKIEKENYEVDCGKTVTLECVLIGISNSKAVCWHRIKENTKMDDIIIDGSKYMGSNVTNPSLVIVNVNENDTGFYFCTAKVEDREVTGEKVSVSVQGIKMASLKYKVDYSRATKLMCTFFRSPRSMSVCWYRHSLDSTTQRIVIDSSKYKGSTLDDPSLEIVNVNENDTGSYFCTATFSGNEELRGDTVSVLVQGM